MGGGLNIYGLLIIGLAAGVFFINDGSDSGSKTGSYLATFDEWEGIKEGQIYDYNIISGKKTVENIKFRVEQLNSDKGYISGEINTGSKSGTSMFTIDPKYYNALTSTLGGKTWNEYIYHQAISALKNGGIQEGEYTISNGKGYLTKVIGEKTEDGINIKFTERDLKSYEFTIDPKIGLPIEKKIISKTGAIQHSIKLK